MPRERKYTPESELPHLWAHQARTSGSGRVQDLGTAWGGYGQGRGSRMSFEGPLFYSYRTGIARLGRFKGKEYVILNRTKYSNTTAKHQHAVRMAVSHMTSFEVHKEGFGTRLDYTPKQLVDHYRQKGEEKAKETHKQKRMMFSVWGSARLWFLEAKRAAEFFGLGTKQIERKVQWCIEQQAPYVEAMEKWEAGAQDRKAKRDKARSERQAKWDAQRAQHCRSEVERFIEDPKGSYSVPYDGYVMEDLRPAYDEACRIRAEWKMEQGREKLEAWMRGEGDYRHEFQEMPVRLRAKQDGTLDNGWEIQTSHGAVIPYQDGRKCFLFCARLWKQGKEWRRNGEQFEVGHYHLDSINAHGLIAGCHHISKETIEAFARAEGWIQSTESTHEDTPPTMEVVA